jgi:hypothetical protein
MLAGDQRERMLGETPREEKYVPMIRTLFNPDLLLTAGRAALAEYPAPTVSLFSRTDVAVALMLACMASGIGNPTVFLPTASHVSCLPIAEVTELFELLNGSDPERHLWRCSPPDSCELHH